LMALGLRCLAFQEMLREDLHTSTEVPRLQLPSFCWLFVFLWAATEKTQEENTTLALHIFTCIFFPELKNLDCKNCTKLSATKLHHTGASCMRAPQLETRCWISPASTKSLYKSIFTRHGGIMLPVICLTSLFRWSLHAQPSVIPVRRTTCSEQGGLLPGRDNGVRPKGRNGRSTGIFWRRLSVPHASSWTCA